MSHPLLKGALLSALLVGLLPGCGCGRPIVGQDAGVEDAGAEVDAGDAFDAGEPEVDAGAPDAGPKPQLAVRRLLPPRGSSAGGTAVLLEGAAFLRDFAGSG